MNSKAFSSMVAPFSIAGLDGGVVLAALAFLVLAGAIYFLSGMWGGGPDVLGISIGR